LNRHGVLVVMVLGFGLACGIGLNASKSAKDERPILSERLGLSAAPAKKLDVGEECTAYEGSAACKSDLCLRVARGFPPKGFCTVTCEPALGGKDCPDGPGPAWRCEQTWPSEFGWFCVPPKQHAGQQVKLKGAAVPLPKPRSLASSQRSNAGGSATP
jgi:hypothetical protein